MEFSLLIKQRREEMFGSARSFFAKSKLPCSYYYYSKIESGATPEIELAIKIADSLKINKRKALYAWTRSQMPDSETKAMFTELGDDNPLSSEQMTVGRSLIVNRMQSKLLESDPVYWELIVLMSSYSNFKSIPEKEIAKLFNQTSIKVHDYLTELYNHGLLDKDKNGKFITKEWVFIPYESDFEKLRDLNFFRALKQFTRLPSNKRFRTTITRLLTKEQQREFESKVVALSNSIVDMKEYPLSSGAECYTVGIFASQRLFGEE